MAARFALCCGFGSVSERRETRTTSARAVALGLDDPKPEGAPTRAKKKGVDDVAKRETSKLKAANSIAKNTRIGAR